MRNFFNKEIERNGIVVTIILIVATLLFAVSFFIENSSIINWVRLIGFGLLSVIFFISIFRKEKK